MVGSRFMIAGMLLFLFTKSLDWRSIAWQEVFNTYLMGTLFMTFGVGSTVWAQQYLDSGIACLLGGTNPLMVVLLMWGLYGEQIKIKASLGIVLGLIGMLLLVSQSDIVSEKSTIIGIITTLFAVGCWSLGSVLIPKVKLPQSKSLSTGFQMLFGGSNLVLISVFSGESNGLDLTNIPLISWVAWIYLIVFGSLAAFSAFNYLLLQVSPSKVATSAYVNPIVAVFLGWWFRDEVITLQTILAAAIMITAVFFINSAKRST